MLVRWFDEEGGTCFAYWKRVSDSWYLKLTFVGEKEKVFVGG